MKKIMWIGFVVFLVVAGYIAGRPPETSSPTEDQTAMSGHHKVNERVQIGYWSYKILSWQWADSIGYPAFERPDAKFLILNMAVENEDRSASVLPPVKLIDSDGREYEQSAKGSFSDNYFGPLKSLNPGVASRGMLAFDIPSGKYSVLVSGGFHSTETAIIDLESSGPIAQQQRGGNAPAATTPNTQASPPSDSSNTPETTDVAPQASPDSENREEILIDKICGSASDVNECTKRELPAMGTVIRDTTFQDQQRFEKAKKRCLPLFPNDSHMLVYCILQIYSGLPPSN